MTRVRLQHALPVLIVLCLDACSTGRERAPTDAGAADTLFEPVARVVTHPRCLNCHTITQYPRQGGDRHAHGFLVARGLDDHGAVGKRCSECHQMQNQDNGVPGAPNWRLAPLEMSWESEAGKAMSVGSLCRRLLDRSRNGNRDVAQLALHLESEPLVLWAWRPGNNLEGEPRESPRLTHAQFLQAFRAWEAAGAPC